LVIDTIRNRQEFEWLYENISSAEFIGPMRPGAILELGKEVLLVGENEIIRPIIRWNKK